MAISLNLLKKRPRLSWQRLTSKGGGVSDVYRTPVPGGWLVALGMEGEGITFVPDPDHLWDGYSLLLDD